MRFEISKIRGAIMEVEEKRLAEKRKRNMRTYSIHRMLTFDLLFYYAIKFLFLTQEKNFTAEQIVIASAFWGLFKVLFQIPITTLIEKIGNKKSLIISDLLQALSIIFVMCATNMQILILSNLLGALSCAMKEVAEPVLLNMAIPDVEDRSKIFSKIDGRALGNYYYISAISAMLSGILFDVNAYIPMTICIIILIISAVIANRYKEIERDKEIRKNIKSEIKNLKLAFSFIFNSRRLKAIMLYSGIMYGMIMAIGTYEMGLLDEIKISATATGIIYAIMQLIAGVASKKNNQFHEKHRNKSLAIIGISYTLACLIAGIISVTKLPHFIIVGIIIITYSIRYISTGLYYVLIKKYVTNFTNIEVADKIYSAHGLVTGIGNAVICAIGAVIVRQNSIINSMIIFGITFFIIMIFVLQYMNTRLGLKPKDYRRKDINYKEYISLK